jgi:protoporphyrinogen oxidase
MAGKRMIVIGGNAAGMSAASQVRRKDPQREIRVFEQSPHVSYSA